MQIDLHAVSVRELDIGSHMRPATMPKEQLGEQLFDVANQLNRGAGRLADPNEKAEAAAVNLRTGRWAKASAAFA